MSVKLTKVKIKMEAKATIDLTLDTETYESLSEKDLENLAIAKLKKKEDINWVCEDFQDKQVELSEVE